MCIIKANIMRYYAFTTLIYCITHKLSINIFLQDIKDIKR